MDIKIPEFADDDWLREQFRALREGLVEIVEVEEDMDIVHKAQECLSIIDALQEYAGY